MRLLLEENLASANDLDELADATIATLQELREEDGCSVWMVSGAISADGNDRIPDNITELFRQRTVAMRQLGERAITFTAPFVFTPEIYARLGIFSMEPAVREEALRLWWDKILYSGQVDGVVFTPGFERSTGSMREHTAAKALDLAIRYSSNLN